MSNLLEIMSTETAATENIRQQIGECELTYPVPIPVNGTWSGVSIGENSARIRPLSFIPVFSGDVIHIKNGNMAHAVGLFKTPLTVANRYRNDPSFLEYDEDILITTDGFFIIAFADKDDKTSKVSPLDFTGSVSITTSLRNKDKYCDIYAMYISELMKIYSVAFAASGTSTGYVSANRQLMVADKGKSIVSGTNLNTLTDRGVYCCGSRDIAASCLNTPVTTSGFRLEVVNTTANSSSNIVQRLYVNAEQSETYMRFGTGKWYKYTGVECDTLNPSASTQSED